MRVPEVMRLIDYWSTNPPTHILVAAALGVKDNRPRPRRLGEPASAGSMSAEQFLAALGGAVKYEGDAKPPGAKDG